MTRIACLLLVFASSIAAEEETVVLRNGDRVTGEVLTLIDGIFEVRTPYGSLSIPKHNVVRIEFARGPLERILPPEIRDVLRSEDPRTEQQGDLLRTAIDLIESYQLPEEWTDRQRRIDEALRRFESILRRDNEEKPEREEEEEEEEKDGEEKPAERRF